MGNPQRPGNYLVMFNHGFETKMGNRWDPPIKVMIFTSLFVEIFSFKFITIKKKIFQVWLKLVENFGPLE